MENLAKVLPPDVVEMFQKFAAAGMGELKVTDYKGYKILPGFSADCVDFAYNNWNVRDGDVYVVSYPKTGTRWVLQIVRQLLYQNDPLADNLSRKMPFPLHVIEIGKDPALKFGLIDKLPLKRRVIGTHMPAELINIDKIKKANGKIVYVLRNPKDQMLSWYEFLQFAPPTQAEPLKSMLKSGWDKYFEHAVAGEIPVHTKPGEWYPEHIKSWLPHRGDKTVMFVYYEDLKKDLAVGVRRIAEFIGTPTSEEKLSQITEASEFESMKKNLPPKDTLNGKLAHLNMRKGVVGGWKERFSDSQEKRLDAIMEEKLEHTDITFRYE